MFCKIIFFILFFSIYFPIKKIFNRNIFKFLLDFLFLYRMHITLLVRYVRVKQHVFYVTLRVTLRRDVSILGVAPATNDDERRTRNSCEESTAERSRVQPNGTTWHSCTRWQRCKRLLGSRVRSGGCSLVPSPDTTRSLS